MNSIYVSSKSKHAAMWRDYRNQAIPIKSTWIDLNAPGAIMSWPEFWEICIAEAQAAEVTWLYHVRGEAPLRGAFVEIGAALAAGRRIIVTASDENLSELGSWWQHPLVTVTPSRESALKLMGFRQ